MDMPDEQLLAEELSKKRVKDTNRAIYYLMKIRNTVSSFQTIRGRKLLEDLLPRFIEGALQSADADLALLHLVDFAALMAKKESYLETIAQRMELISSLIFIFSHSEYLSKIIMSNMVYLDSLEEGEVREKRLTRLKKQLTALAGLYGTNTAVRLFKRLEEVELGILFLDGKMDILELMKSLTKVAEAIVELLVMEQDSAAPSLSVVSYGKLGGRELHSIPIWI